MASPEELTAQIVSLNDQVRGLTNRLHLAEQELLRQGAPRGVAGAGGPREDDKRLYPDGLTEKGKCRDFSEDFLDWMEDRSEELHREAMRAMDEKEEVENHADGKSSKKYYRLLKRLVKAHPEAKQVVKNTPNSNFLEAWRRLARRFDPQTDGVHALQLKAILGFNNDGKRAAKVDQVPLMVTKWEKAMQEYHHRVGEEAINTATKRGLC